MNAIDYKSKNDLAAASSAVKSPIISEQTASRVMNLGAGLGALMVAGMLMGWL